MANLVSNYKNFKGESAPAKMAILDGTSTVKCSHPNSIISIIPTRTERTLFRLSKAEGTGHKPCPSLLFFSLSFQTEEKRTGNEAEKSFFRRS